MNLELLGENPVLHEMRCMKRYKGVALNDYQINRLLKALLQNEQLNNGDWYNDVLSKLIIAKYGVLNYDTDKILDDLRNV